ncbi:hypothetical protein I4U23_020291 [Adineta vaga]|nr:hypothetical protein I4U23_020291 [Adineta vaga]
MIFEYRTERQREILCLFFFFKKQKYLLMRLEILPNELFFHFFSFIDVVHLFRAFFGLNNRFNYLLFNHLQTHQLNLRRISKHDFDLMCKQYFPAMIYSIRSLYLSNEETPQLCDLLSSRGYDLNRFIHLQSLSLHHISSLQILIPMISLCRTLRQLTHLFIIDCSIDQKQKQPIVDLFNNIWSISSLIHCDLNGITLNHISFSHVSIFPRSSSSFVVTSTSIRNLLIENISCDFDSLSYLLTSSTPHLQQLSTTVYSHSKSDTLTCTIPSITSLRLFFRGCIESMTNLFKHLPNLRQLTIETVDLYVDGHQWKEILLEHVRHLKIFHLKMQIEISGDDVEVKEHVDTLVDSFRTKYWIDEHRWFVRCDWESSEITTYAYLYTLPFVFKNIHYFNEYQTESTCSKKDHKEEEEEDNDVDNYRSYECVEMFTNNHRKTLHLHSFSIICNRYRHIRVLDVIFPFEVDVLNSSNLTFDNLLSLTVRMQISSGYSQLQRLCDRSLRLYSLRIIFWQKCLPKLCVLKSQSIRRIEINGMFNWNDVFSREECLTFCTSSLAQQCEVVTVEIEDRKSIIDLVERMENVRLLNVRCSDDRWNERKMISTENELIRWIENQFPSTYVIVRDVERSSYIQIWIDQQERRAKYKNGIATKSGQKMPQLITSIQKLLRKK